MAAVEFDSGGHSLLAIQFPQQPIHQLIKFRRRISIAIFPKLVALSRSGGLLLFCSQLGTFAPRWVVCAYKAEPIAAPSYNVVTSFSNKVPGK
jgi:hypothetical protein